MIGQFVQPVKDNVSNAFWTKGRQNWPMAKKDKTSSDFKADFIARVKATRERKFASAKEMATALGVGHEAYAKYESRSWLPHELVIKFALITGVSVEYLYTGKEPTKRMA